MQKTDPKQESLLDIEKAWKADAAKTPEALVEAFPDEQEIVMRNLREYWHEAARLYIELKRIRNIVDRVQTDTFSKWFFLKAEKFKEGKRLRALREKIERLERLKMAYERKKVEGQLSKEYFKTVKERERFDTDKMLARPELLVDIASFYGVTLKPSGTIFKGLCPFHDEKTPSFYIYRDNWAHCFGCSWHGNIFDFVMQKKGCTFREALEEVNVFL